MHSPSTVSSSSTATTQHCSRTRFIAFTTHAKSAEHEVGIRLYYSGHGYGIFSYLKGYRFHLATVAQFDVIRGRDAKLTVVAYEGGSVFTPVEKRPAVRLETDP